MDLELEITNHLEWIDSVALLLDKEQFTENELNDITGHENCKLGQWLASEGAELYSGVPEFSQLLHDHETFHKLAGELITALQSGKESEAIEAQQALIGMSRDVIAHLQVLQEISSTN